MNASPPVDGGAIATPILPEREGGRDDEPAEAGGGFDGEFEADKLTSPRGVAAKDMGPAGAPLRTA